MRWSRLPRRSALTALVLVTLGIGLLPLPGHGHVVREEPWHPVPAGYLRSLFYLQLKPVDWDLVAREYDRVTAPDSSLESLWQGLAPASRVDGTDHEAAIRGAISRHDPVALATSSTRAVSQLTRFHLRSAEEALGEPGVAGEHVREAARIYRAFERFIEHADPLAARALGLAWLELSTAVGNAGVESRGAQPADAGRFRSARSTVEDYLVANYETGERSAELLEPLPATVTDAEPMPPWLPPGSDLNDQDPLPRLVLNFEERGIDERDLFLVAYGDMLFDSPEIFGDPARSLGITCSTCHNRSDTNRRFFIPGV
ncbi:MAG: cytochrome C, partial [Acidobacteriota bacterium]